MKSAISSFLASNKNVAGDATSETKTVVHVNTNGAVDERVIYASRFYFEDRVVAFLDAGDNTVFAVNIDCFISAQGVES